LKENDIAIFKAPPDINLPPTNVKLLPAAGKIE